MALDVFCILTVGISCSQYTNHVHDNISKCTYLFLHFVFSYRAKAPKPSVAGGQTQADKKLVTIVVPLVLVALLVIIALIAVVCWLYRR